MNLTITIKNLIHDWTKSRVRSEKPKSTRSFIELGKVYHDWLYKKDSVQLAKKFFLPLFDEYLNTIRSSSAELTILNKTTVRNFTQENQELKGLELHLNDFNSDFFEQLRNCAFKSQNKEGDLVDGTIQGNFIAKIIATLKAFLTWATDTGHTQNHAFWKYSAPRKRKPRLSI